MAISGSGLFVANFIDALDTTGTALDFESETDLKIALYPASITPDYDAAAASAAYAAGVYSGTELTGTGYTAGGNVLTTTTWTGSSGVATFDAADTSWTSSTITGARGALVYDNGLTPKAAIVLIDLGTGYSTAAGTLAINFAAGGIFTIDFVP
jgi:hypothetical protein